MSAIEEFRKEADRVGALLSGWSRPELMVLEGTLRVAPLEALLDQALAGSLAWRSRLWIQVVEDHWREAQEEGRPPDIIVALLEFLDRSIDLWIQREEVIYPDSEAEALRWIDRVVVRRSDREWFTGSRT